MQFAKPIRVVRSQPKDDVFRPLAAVASDEAPEKGRQMLLENVRVAGRGVDPEGMERAAAGAHQSSPGVRRPVTFVFGSHASANAAVAHPLAVAEMNWSAPYGNPLS